MSKIKEYQKSCYKLILSKNNTVEFGQKSNSNVFVVGDVGSYKTRGYVIPNVMNDDYSMVIIDAKGEIEAKTRQIKEMQGYKVISLNFENPALSQNHYNPLHYINGKEKEYQNDILYFADMMFPSDCFNGHIDPFWPNNSKNMIAAITAYMTEKLPEEEQTLEKLSELINQHNKADMKGISELDKVFEQDNEDDESNNLSFAQRTWNAFNAVSASPKMRATIISEINSRFLRLLTDDVIKLTNSDDCEIDRIGDRKTIVYIHTSDTDRSKDFLVSMFIHNCLEQLKRKADKSENMSLSIHTHFIFDDIGCNVKIDNLDGYMSCLRSREISISLVLQSEHQMKKMYGDSYHTIISNCAYYLFMSSGDLEACEIIARKMDKPLEDVMYKNNDTVFILPRCQKPFEDYKYLLQSHPMYKYLDGEYYKQNEIEIA
ncbi:MAG: VirD4-like conjugal transfer protein, CD1115 family [Eubacterium sp.]